MANWSGKKTDETNYSIIKCNMILLVQQLLSSTYPMFKFDYIPFIILKTYYYT